MKINVSIGAWCHRPHDKRLSSSLRTACACELNPDDYEIYQDYDLNPDYPDEPPEPGFRPGAPKM